MMVGMTITKRLEKKPEKSLREYGAPSAHVIKKPILFPKINVEEYQIDTELIHILQDRAFGGQEDENPRDHLEMVDTLCGTFKRKGLSKEFVCLKLFRCSLKDKAFAWLQSLPHNCITCWEDCIRLFTQKFTSFNKMIQVKREITIFLQRIGESFAQAWERFSKLVNSVPNHGYAEFVIMQSFYNGLDVESKQMIDLTIGGSLSGLTLKQCEELISIRASNDEQYNTN
jgi:hypothetical protein